MAGFKPLYVEPNALSYMYSYVIDDSEKLVSIRAEGEVDLESSKGILESVLKDARYLSSFDFLVDVRAMTKEPSKSDALQFLHFLGDAKKLDGRFALVTSGGLQYGMARMTAALAQLRNIEMSVFRDEPGARQWLRGGAEAD